jgi:hypothetical protein
MATADMLQHASSRTMALKEEEAMEGRSNGFADKSGEAGKERNHVNGGGSFVGEGRRNVNR